MSVVQFSARGLELQGNLSRFQPNFATLRPDFEYQVRVEPRPSGEELAREFREMMDNAQRAPEDVGKSEEEIMEEVIDEIAEMRAEDRSYRKIEGGFMMSDMGKAIIEAMEKTLATGDRGKIVRYAINVASIRKSMGMSQNEFGKIYKINVKTLRSWERGKRIPDSVSTAYLTCISRNGKMVQELLHQST